MHSAYDAHSVPDTVRSAKLFRVIVEEKLDLQIAIFHAALKLSADS